MAEYLVPNVGQLARERVALLEQVLDPGTIQRLETVGVAPGWQCLEVGAGAGSIAAWLCQRVGPDGRVLATDIDTRFLAALSYANLEVRDHNIVTDALEEHAFDLVHARFVLAHLAAEEEVLRTALAKMVRALKPGGWLVLEEVDGPYLADPRFGERFATLLARHITAFQQVLQAAGGNLFYGRRLYGDVLAQGVSDLATDGRIVMVRGGSPEGGLWLATFDMLREALLATGHLRAEEADELRTLYDRPDICWLGLSSIGVWGRRPAE